MREVDGRNCSNLVAAAVAVLEKKSQTHIGGRNGFNSSDLYGSLRRRNKGKSADSVKNSAEGVDTVESRKSAFTNLGFSSKNNRRTEESSGETRPPDANGKQSPGNNSETRSGEAEEGEEPLGNTAASATDDIFELAVQDFDITAEEVQKFVQETDRKKVEVFSGRNKEMIPDIFDVDISV